MSDISTKFFADKAAGALWDVAVSIKRGNPLPLDRDAVVHNLTELEALKTSPVTYPGQIVAVISDAVLGDNDVVVTPETTTLYYFDHNLEYHEVGKIPVGDDKTIEVSADGAISLLGAAGAANGTLPMIDSESGKLVWKTLEDIGAGDGNDNTTYEFSFAGEKITITPKFNGVAQDAVELDLSTFVTADELATELGKLVDNDTTYSVAEGEKVLKLNDTVFSTEIGLKHENGKISLTGINGEVIAEFSDADFVKDSVLEDVEYDANTKEIVFTWKTIDGETKTDKVSVADFVQIYTAGNGLELNANEFAVKVDGESESFLSVGANGVKLSGVQDAINNAKQAAIDDAAGKYATTGALSQLETALDGRLDSLEAINHDLYATKEELKPIETTANNASTAVANLETRFDEIVAVGGEPNAINKIQVNGVEQTISNKTVNIAVPTKFTDLTDDSGFDARITAAKQQADKGVSDAAAADAKAVANTEEIGKHTTRIGALETAKGDHETRIIALENADTQHASEYNALKGIVDGHTTAIAGKAEQTVLDAVSAKVTTNETAIKTLNETTIPGLNTEIGKKANAADVYTKTEIGTIATDKTLVEMIADAKSEATYDDTEIKASIKANSDAIAILNGDVETAGSVAKVAADAVKAEVATVIGAAPEAMDTLEEVAKWIENDESGAAAMANRIGANETAIAAINNADNGILAQAKEYTNTAIAGIPVATAEVLGLVKFDNDTVKMNENNQLYVAKVSTDILEQGTEIIVLNGGSATDSF